LIRLRRPSKTESRIAEPNGIPVYVILFIAAAAVRGYSLLLLNRREAIPTSEGEK
jgi:hypothetical protein